MRKGCRLLLNHPRSGAGVTASRGQGHMTPERLISGQKKCGYRKTDSFLSVMRFDTKKWIVCNGILMMGKTARQITIKYEIIKRELNSLYLNEVRIFV